MGPVSPFPHQVSSTVTPAKRLQGPPAPAAFQPPLVIFQPPEIVAAPPVPKRQAAAAVPAVREPDEELSDGDGDGQDDGGQGPASRRRRRGGRGRGKARDGADGAESGAQADDTAGPDQGDAEDEQDDDGSGTSSGGKRRRRRRRTASGGDGEPAHGPGRPAEHRRARPGAAGEDLGCPDVRGVKGSTRLEAKRQRRREGRESGRRRPPIITESEFLARREAVERVMVVRQTGERTQIAVLEDGVLVEHYVDKASHQSYVGNVYLGKVQNVLPSMEAAFVDIGKGRNAVLYAGEVNFDASGLEGESKRIESALKSGQSILVQVTKDPIGHKGARLTSQVSLPGRYLVYVPGASMTGISRKLPDTERTRLKQILKQVMPENAGRDRPHRRRGRLGGGALPRRGQARRAVGGHREEGQDRQRADLLYSEPDLTLRVVRDIFNEDFSNLVIASDSEWDMVDEYVRYVAPHLSDRMQRWDEDKDVFAAYRIDEQLAKALERKVWLPSGGSLVIDHTEAMTVIDVNTGKFTGQGGNLEQTVTRNNLEAAEEIVRQLRLRDLGGIIVIDFIDMVLESNRELVLRRLLECLARDRTKHQVAEVTSLGLVQMTRKRVGSGLLEAFSVPCEHCNGRGVIISLEPVDHSHNRDGGQDQGGKGGRRPGRSQARARQSGGGKSGQDWRLLRQRWQRWQRGQLGQLGRLGGRGRGSRSRSGSGGSNGSAAAVPAELAAAGQAPAGPAPGGAGNGAAGDAGPATDAPDAAGHEPVSVAAPAGDGHAGQDGASASGASAADASSSGDGGDTAPAASGRPAEGQVTAGPRIRRQNRRSRRRGRPGVRASEH